MGSNMAEVVGRHIAAYEALYKEIDPNSNGVISAQEAAAFMKRSGVAVALLGKIWEIADYNRTGSLNKDGFFIALKLIAAVQQGQPPTRESLKLDLQPPVLVRGSDSAAASPSMPMFASSTSASSSSTTENWLIKPEEKMKYDSIFDSLGPEGGKLKGDRVKPVLLNSGLPTNILGKIWELSDVDKDGLLDRDEMAVALHLVYRSLENDPLPNVLPQNLVPPSKRGTAVPRRTSLAGAVPVLPPPAATGGLRSRASSVTSVDSLGVGGATSSMFGSQSQVQDRSRSLTSTPTPLTVKPPSAWIVDKGRYDALFQETDKDVDGLVSGLDAKGVFMESGLAQNYLAHIWNLCDIKHDGMLNAEQFALAMYLIDQKRNYNIEPPPALTPDLVPPSFRPSPAGMTDMGTSTNDTDLSTVMSSIPPLAANQPSGNKEIDVVQKEIEDMQREKRKFETDIVQLEADLTIKNSEIKNLEVELSTLQASVGHLERQKGEAQKRLEELDNQRGGAQNKLDDLKRKIVLEQSEVSSLKQEITNSTQNIQSQEDQLNRKRVELQSLREEENKLEVKVEMAKASIQQTDQQSESVESQIQQVLSHIQQLREHNELLTQKLNKLDSVLQSGDASALDSDPSLLSTDDLKLHLQLVDMSCYTPPATLMYPDPTLPIDALACCFRSHSLWDGIVVPDVVPPTQPLQSMGGFPGNTPSYGIPQPSVSQGGLYPSVPTDGFKSNDLFAQTTSTPDPFASQEDPFKDSGTGNFDDPFTGSDPFASRIGANAGGGIGGDSLGGAGPAAPVLQGGGFGFGTADAFGGSDQTGLVGPPSAAPSLPPKHQQQQKKPPPRPAPPKNRPITPKSGVDGGDPFTSQSSVEAGPPVSDSDPFGGPPMPSQAVSSGGGGNGSGFANFADFSQFG